MRWVLLVVMLSGCTAFESAVGYSSKLYGYHRCMEECSSSRVVTQDCGCKKPSEMK